MNNPPPNDDLLPSRPPASGGRGETLFRLVPALDSLRSYTFRDLRCDAVAGLTVAALAVPQAMAYALVAGTGPEFGLYTAIVMTAVGALLDSSKQLINGPTNAIAIALLSALAPIPQEQKVPAAILMALLVGVIQTGITLWRLGDLTRYVSHAVIVGFLLGAAVLLVLDQLKNLLGLAGHGQENAPFLQQFWQTMTDGGPVHYPTLAIGLAAIALLLILRRISHRLRIRLPEFLMVMAVLALAVWAFDLEESGVKVIGALPRGLPSFQLPMLDFGLVRQLAGSALAIALLGLLEAIAMAKAIAVQTGQKLDINQQCLSEGLANLTGSFFQCFPGSGSLTRSTINQQAGAVTQWSGVISAGAVAAALLLFAPLAHFIPRSALAGILMVSAYRMVDRKQLRYYLRATRFDAGIVLITALAAVAISVEFCILIGTMLSFVLYVPRAARLHLNELTVTPERVIRERTAGDPPCGRIVIFDLEGEMFFGSSPELERHFARIEERAVEGVRIVVLRLKRARNPDAVCLDVIDLFAQRLAQRKIILLLCGVRLEVAQVLGDSGLANRIGAAHIFHEDDAVGSSTLDAVRFAYDLLGEDLCATCPRRQEGGNGKEPLYYMI